MLSFTRSHASWLTALTLLSALTPVLGARVNQHRGTVINATVASVATEAAAEGLRQQAAKASEEAKLNAEKEPPTSSSWYTWAMEQAENVKEMGLATKTAAWEAANNRTTGLLQATLGTAGVCPAMVSANNDLIKDHIPDLVDKVANELVGDCKELKSEGCVKRLSELISGLLVEATEWSMGVRAAKQVIKTTDQLTGTIGKFTDQAKCNIDAAQGGFDASENLKNALPRSMKSINDLSEKVDLMHHTIENVNKLLDPAKALVKFWDDWKKVIKDVLGTIGSTIGSTVITQVLPFISVQETVEKKDKFSEKMVDYLQKNLGGSITQQLETYCPDASSSSDDEAGAAKLGDSLNSMGDSLNAMLALRTKLEDAKQSVKDQMNDNLLSLVDNMTAEFTKSEGDKSNEASEALKKVASDIISCNKKLELKGLAES